jgi:hypothetical protein
LIELHDIDNRLHFPSPPSGEFCGAALALSLGSV